MVLLYTAVHDELAPIRPLPKFLCIKAIVFMTWWQSIVIAALVRFGVLRGGSGTPFPPSGEPGGGGARPTPEQSHNNEELSDSIQVRSLHVTIVPLTCMCC